MRDIKLSILFLLQTIYVSQSFNSKFILNFHQKSSFDQIYQFPSQSQSRKPLYHNKDLPNKIDINKIIAHNPRTHAEGLAISRDWVKCLKGWPRSQILAKIKYQIIAIAAFTVLLQTFLTTYNIKLIFPFFIHIVVGSVLSLLLVFKTNTSYDRFWEGRKLWGSVISVCRAFARVSYVHINKVHHKDVFIMLMLFCIAMKQHLRSEKNPSEYERYINKSDISYILNYQNPALIVLRTLESKIFVWLEERYKENNIELSNILFSNFREYIDELSATLGACERIVKTPAPFFYSINTSRFLTLYLFSLPLAILPIIGWYTVPTIMAISWCFISILEIGNYIEDPFGGKKEVEVVPVDELTSVIKNNMEETLNLSNESSQSQSSNIYYTSTKENNNSNKNGTDTSDTDIIESICLFE